MYRSTVLSLLLLILNNNAIGNDCWINAPIVLNACSSDVESSYLIVVHGSPKCGYCNWLMRDFQNAIIPENVSIVFLMKDVSPELIKKNLTEYRCQEVRLTTSKQLPCGIKTLPTVKLYRRKNNSWRKVKTIKGYHKNLWNRVFSKCE